MKQFGYVIACSLLIISGLLQAATTDQYISEAETYLEQGEIKAAVIQLKNALQQEPTSIEARLMLGKIYLKAGDMASAEKEFERTKDLNAAKSYWLEGLGRAYLLQGKFQEILDSIEEDPDASPALQLTTLLLRGDAHLGLGQNDQAREAFTAAKSMDPDSPRAELGLIMIALAEESRTETLNSLDDLVTQHPEYVPALILHAELNLQRGQADQALKDFDQVLSLQPNNLRALLGRANIKLTNRDLEAARADIARAQELAPGHPQLLHLSGTIALLERDLDKAETLLQQAQLANPGNLQTQTMLGAVNFYKGNYESARQHLSQVLEQQPALLPAIKLLASVQHKLKQPKAVIELLEPAMEMYPGDPKIMAMLGTAYMQVERYEEGSNLMTQAIEISPELAEYRTQLALGLLAQGKTGDAIQELESTVDLNQDSIQADLLLVLSHLKREDYEKALETSRRLEARAPNNPVGYNLTGFTYMVQGRIEEAEQRFRQALEIDPDFITAEANLARLALQKGDLDQARTHYESALKKSPRHSAILIGLAELAKRRGDLDEMHRFLEQAREGSPRTSRPGRIAAQAYMTQQQPLKALRITSQLIADYPNEPTVLVLHGRVQLAAGDPINAITTFTRLNHQVSNPEILHLLATAQQSAERFEEARATYQQALTLQPGYAPALAGLYALELAEGHYEAAIEHARIIQQSLPNQAVGYEFEGTAHALQRKPEKAIPLYEKAHQLQPNEKHVVLLAVQYGLMGDKQRAIDLLKEWTAQYPGHLEARVNLGNMLLNQGEHEAAIGIYETVLESNSENVVTLNNLAWLYANKGDERALGLAKRAYELAPGAPAIIDTYGWILVQAGNYNEGTNVLKQAAELAPENQEILYHLGYSLHKQGNDDEARPILEKAAAITTGSELATTANSLLKQLK